MFMFLQAGRAFALKIAHLKDPEVCKLAADLPLRTIEVKAPSTTERYSRAFQKFREWSSPYTEVVCLPSVEISVSLYLESLIQAGSPYSSISFPGSLGTRLLILLLSLLAMVLIGRIICMVFKVLAIPNWLGTCLRQLKEVLRNLFLGKNPLPPL